MVFGLLALILQRDKKREFCAIYLGGLVLEELADFWFVTYINSDWVNYYLMIATIDIFTVSVMTHAYHKSYILAYPIMFMMFLVNALIVVESDSTGSHFAYDVRLDILHPFNVLILMLFLGADNGFKRFFSDIRNAGRTFGSSYNVGALWGRMSIQDLPNLGIIKGRTCKTQQQR